jgi:hypothetical protein
LAWLYLSIPIDFLSFPRIMSVESVVVVSIRSSSSARFVPETNDFP